MFSFPFIHGDPETALENQNGVVLSAETAEKYFGAENPLGKVMILNSKSNLVVTGVVSIPGNSSIQFDLLASLNNRSLNNWNWRDPSYLLLEKGCSISGFREKIAEYLNLHYPHMKLENFTVDIMPITRMHLDFGKRVYVNIFSVIAIFILLIACINYMNLSTACSSGRLKEIGLRKVVGARRTQVVTQFIGESIIISACAMVFSLILARLGLPVLNNLTTKHLTLSIMDNYYLIFLSIGLIFTVGFVSGIYPAFYLTSSKPADTLKSSLQIKTGRSIFRIVSVVIQFTISILLITCTILVFDQLNFVRKRPLGFNTDHILQIKMNNELQKNFENFRTELMRNPNVRSVTASQAVPFNEDYKTNIEWEDKNPDMASNVRYSITDYDYIETFHMEIVEGRSFSRDFTDDIHNFVVNQKAVTYMGMEAPLGKQLRMWGVTGTIIGVVKDFHHVSLHREIMPHVMTINPSWHNWFRFIYVKISGSNLPGTIQSIEASARQFAPNYPFAYSFTDQGISDLYHSEENLGRIFGYFSGIAIIISCLGIFGLSAYTAEQKTKEIGIRKVLGSSVTGIVILLSRQFSKWILMGMVVSWPIGWFFIHKWLQNFVYRTPIRFSIFIFSGLLAFGIALITVGYQSYKAAHANPVDSLRYE